MSPRDDSARDPVRLHEEWWAAESPFVGEAAEEQAQIHPWYQGYTPFVEGRELEEMYAPEAEWESDLAALEAESPFQNAFVEGRTGLIEPEELEEGLAVEEGLRLQGPGLQSLLSSQECQKRLKSTSVAVVGGGLGGLMAARELGRHGIKVTVFEARSQVGGRVLSNRKFSNGRITEEGAELIGSFHTEWLALAQKYGLACISRMDDSLYGRECLSVKLTLDRPLTMKEIDNLWTEAETRVLKPIARLAERIHHPSQPWLEAGLKRYDSMSVADALTRIFGVKPTERLWKAMEFLLVNNEVAPLDRMNFLGLLCKVKAGQGARCSAVDTGPEERLMGYWNELEIFRSADGCQELANKMTEEIRAEYGSRILLSTAVTHIALSKQGVMLVPRKVVDDSKGKLADKPLHPLSFDYVILAIPPSVWADVKISADGKDAHPKDEIGVIGMGPAVKFFSDVKERFWIKEHAAPSGGSLTLGQVWEGTDNQTRIPGSGQGIVLSVFAGPIIPIPFVAGGTDRRAPNPGEFDKGLRQLYPGYTRNLKKKPLFSDWPNVPFIKTGYASPRKDEIFTIGKKLSEPFRDRLFFAGEHTQMAFFGYMEGALRSGKRAANTLMLQGCGLLKEPAPASPTPPVRIASAAPIRAKTASEYETGIPLEEHSTTDHPGEAESPFLRQEPFVGESEEEWEPRAAVLEAESPFVEALEERRRGLDEDQFEGEEVWEDYEEDELGLLHEQPVEERFDPLAVPKDVADALVKEDWPLALKLAIQAGWRDENDLTNLIFFARHPELPPERLDPKGPRFKQLGAEWTKILNEEVWKAIQASAKNTDLVVSGEEVTDHHRRFFRGQSGKRLKKLVEDAAREVDLNPGLLGTIMMAETRRPQSYLSSEKVSSYHIGADDFYEGRAAIKARVPAYAKIKWDKNQEPSEHLNDAKTNRRMVKTILFDSGPDAVLATAVYVKFREVRLREIAAELKGYFDKLPLATRFALTRMAMAAGTAGATPVLKDALKGVDIFIRKAIPVRAFQTKRNATVRTAQAMHLSDWVFGIPVPAAAAAQPELETFEDFDQEVEGFYDFEPESDLSETSDGELDEQFHLEEGLSDDLVDEWETSEPYEAEEFADLENDLLLDLTQAGEAGLQSETSRPRSEVRALQESLNRWRVEKGQTPIKVDGLLKVETSKAVLEFQKASGLKREDGIAGPATQERLRLILAILNNIPTTPVFAEDRRRLLELVGGAGFRSLEGPTQTEVLNRILSYQSPGTLDNIRHLANLVTQTGFELLPTSSQKLMLRALAARPDDAHLADNLGQLASSAGFRSLEGPTQSWVLKRIESYAGNRRKIDNLENLITATMNFERLSKESRNVMLRALAHHPNDARLVDNLRRAVDGTLASVAAGINFLLLDQPTQTDVLNRIVAYPRDPRNVDNLMSLVTTPGFGNLAPGVRAQVLEGLPSRFNNVQLNSVSIGNMMSLMSASGFEKLQPEVRDLMLDVLANRPDNVQLASALRNLAESPRFRHDHRTARQTILQVADSIP